MIPAAISVAAALFDFGKRNGERDVQLHFVRSATRLPQAEHRLAGRVADPEECDTALVEDLGEREPEGVAVEADGAVDVGDGEVGLKEAVDGDHVAAVAIWLI